MELSSLHGSIERVTPRESVRPGEARSAGAAPEVESAGAPPPTDEARFSPEALELSRAGGDAPKDDAVREADGEDAGSAGDKNELSTEERQQLEKLKARDAEVRAHEAAHMGAGGSLVRGGASYSYQQGPDGKQYATGGEVSIDVSSVAGNPQATIQKMQQVRAAALAPAEPSGADRGVAASAAQIEAQARQQLAERTAERVEAAYSEKQSQAAGSLVDAQA
jgi:hypothetical protein